MPDHPLITLSKKYFENKPVERRKRPLLALAYARYLLFEPIRLVDYLLKKRKAPQALARDPIFVLGHWRSGTSLLQYMLCLDPQFGYLNKADMLFPELVHFETRSVRSFIEKLFQYWNGISEFRSISVDWDWEAPGELDIAITLLGETASPHWGHIFPLNYYKYIDKYLFFEDITSEEFVRWQHSYRDFIGRLSERHGDRRLIIKSPNNTSRISQLLEMYPDAKFIYIHRNPYDVYYSNLKLWRMLLEKVSFQRIDEPAIRSIILDTYKRLLTTYLEQRRLVPEGQLFELRYEELVRDPISGMSDLYYALSLDAFDAVESRLESFIHRKRVSMRSKYRYDPEVIKDIEREWAFSLTEWSYEPPVSESELIHPGTDEVY